MFGLGLEMPHLYLRLLLLKGHLVALVDAGEERFQVLLDSRHLFFHDLCEVELLVAMISIHFTPGFIDLREERLDCIGSFPEDLEARFIVSKIT